MTAVHSKQVQCDEQSLRLVCLPACPHMDTH